MDFTIVAPCGQKGKDVLDKILKVMWGRVLVALRMRDSPFLLRVIMLDTLCWFGYSS